MNLLDNPLLELINVTDRNKLNKQLLVITDLIDKKNISDNDLKTLLVTRKEKKGWEGNYVDGFIYEVLLQSKDEKIKDFLDKECRDGIVNLESEVEVKYDKLRELLCNKNFQEADQLTQQKLCELAKIDIKNRSWLYFTDVKRLPTKDLITIDKLWQVHSQGKFGFSIQRQIWLSTNKNWNKLWNKLGWQIQNNLCRYPNEFIWDLSAPAGHLPLFNQLRGVQVLSSVFNHPAWDIV